MDDPVISKVKESLRKKLSDSLSWLDTDEGKIISRAITSLGSFAMGDPTGIVLPLIIESADNLVRKRFVKHFPDLMDKLEKSKARLNEDYIRSESGQSALRETLKKIITESNEEKIELFKKLLIESYEGGRVHEQENRFLFKILSEMEVEHLQILAVLNSPDSVIEKTFEEIKKEAIKLEPPREQVSLLVWKSIRKYYLKMDEHIFEKVLDDLKNWKLLSWSGEISGSYKIDEKERALSEFGGDRITQHTMKLGLKMLKLLN